MADGFRIILQWKSIGQLLDLNHDLRIVRQVFYHCATTTGKQSTSSKEMMRLERAALKRQIKPTFFC
jgi:hypothetical protein